MGAMDSVQLSGEKFKRGTYCLVASCVLAAVAFGGMMLGSTTPAEAASCNTNHVHVGGYDKGNSDAYGNKGWIYVNTSSVIDSLHADTSRSLFIYGPAGYNVEVGWEAHNGTSYPVVYAEWEIGGTTDPPQIDKNSNGQDLATNTNYRFRVEDLGDIGI